MELQGRIAVVERRGCLELGYIKGGGIKKLRVVAGDGTAWRPERGRVVHLFDGNYQTADAGRIAMTRIDASISATPPADIDLLWSHTEADAHYQLDQLAKLYGGDEPTLALLAAFRERSFHFEIRDGGFLRVSAELLAKIRERQRRDEEEARLQEEFQSWVATKPQVRGLDGVPSRLEPALGELSKFALSGGGDTPRSVRRLAKSLDLDDADKLLAFLCRLGALDQDVNELPDRLGLRRKHPPAGQKQLRELLASEPSLGARVDFRDHFTVTIDRPWTEDVDDALSVWRDGEVIRIAIHIADVAAALPEGSPLDSEARRRASTIYFAESILPMLPDELVEHLSLHAGRERLALSVTAAFDARGAAVEEARLVSGLVKVDERLSYVDTLSETWVDDPRLEDLLLVAKTLNDRRVAEGAVHAPRVERRIIRSGSELRIEHLSTDTPGHRIVSELMVFFNTVLASTLAAAAFPAAFKQQPRRVKGPASDDMLAWRKVRFPPSQTLTEPGPHRTMAVPCYVQATAPVRRYLDLVSQRQATAAISGADAAYDREAILALCREQEGLQSKVRRAEDQRRRYWLMRCIECDPGPYEARIIHLDNRGRPQIYISALDLQRPLPADSLREELQVGDALQVIATVVSPREGRASFEPYEEDWDSVEAPSTDALA